MTPYQKRSIIEETEASYAVRTAGGWDLYSDKRDLIICIGKTMLVKDLSVRELYSCEYYVKEGDGYIKASEPTYYTSVDEIINAIDRNSDEFTKALRDYRQQKQ